MSEVEAPRQGARGGAQIAVAMGVMNVATYLYTILAARLLGPVAYGTFAAVMNLFLVIAVLSLALQAVGARRISAEPRQVAHIERGVLRVTTRTALVAGAVLLALSPAVERLLRLDSWPIAVLVAVTTVPLTLMGGQAGVLQGERRWGALGLLYVAAGLPRLMVGTVLMLWQPSELLAVLGVTVGAFFPVLVGWWALRGSRHQADDHASHHGGRSLLREAAANSQALLAYFALGNLDIVVARNVLDPHDSGLYAAGLIVTKTMLFLPQFVVVIAFPSLSTAHERTRALALGMTLIGTLGALGTLLCYLLDDVALFFVGGAEFTEVREQLWLFALLGTVLALMQLTLYSVLAQQDHRASAMLWLGLVAMVFVGATAPTVEGLATRVMLVDAVVLVALLVAALVQLRHRRAEGAATEELGARHGQ